VSATMSEVGVPDPVAPAAPTTGVPR
jgi:hypothetical protein